MRLKRRKNPFIGKPSSHKPNYSWVTKIFEKTNTPYIFVSRSQISDVYYFELKEPKILYSPTLALTSVSLKPGEYIYKVYYNNWELSPLSIKRLISLSGKKLIPHIFYIDQKLIIYDYIEGLDLGTLKNSDLSLYQREKLFNKVQEQLEKWHNLGFTHGDFGLRNIMYDGKNVILIDPIERETSNFDLDLEDLEKCRKEFVK